MMVCIYLHWFVGKARHARAAVEGFEQDSAAGKEACMHVFSLNKPNSSLHTSVVVCAFLEPRDIECELLAMLSAFCHRGRHAIVAP